MLDSLAEFGPVKGFDHEAFRAESLAFRSSLFEGGYEYDRDILRGWVPPQLSHQVQSIRARQQNVNGNQVGLKVFNLVEQVTSIIKGSDAVAFIF